MYKAVDFLYNDVQMYVCTNVYNYVQSKLAGAFMLRGLQEEYKPLISLENAENALSADSVKTSFLQDVSFDERTRASEETAIHSKRKKSMVNRKGEQRKTNKLQLMRYHWSFCKTLCK